MAADATAPAGLAESNPSVAAGTHRVFALGGGGHLFVLPGVLTVYTNQTNGSFTFTPDGGEPMTVTIPAV